MLPRRFLPLLLAVVVIPRPSLGQLVKLSDSAVTTQGLMFSYGAAFSRSINGNVLLSAGTYQYTAWYENDEAQSVMLARRSIAGVRAGPWEVVNTGSTLVNGQPSQDSHNKIALGVAGDGSLHLAWDMHADTLRYRKTAAGVAGGERWGSGMFGAEQQTLVPGSAAMLSVTYPQFIRKPDGGLLFSYRKGGSGNGSNWLFDYDSKAGAWGDRRMVLDGSPGTGTYVDQFNPASNPSKSRNGYWLGVSYAPDGKLVASWTYRESSNQYGNHDINYAVSGDDGFAWRNNAGTLIADTKAGDAITLDDAGQTVQELDRTDSLMNQGDQVVMSDGTVHLLVWHRRPDAPWVTGDGAFVKQDSSYYDYIRDPTTRAWNRTELPGPVGGSTGASLARSADDTVYAAFIRDQKLTVAAATKEAGWADWSVIYTDPRTIFYETPTIDADRLLNDGVLSVLAQQKATVTSLSGSPLRAIEFIPAVGPAWIPSAGGLWDATANWSKAVPNSATATATFEAGRGGGEVFLGQSIAVNRLLFLRDTGTIAATATGALSFAGSKPLVLVSSELTIAAPISGEFTKTGGGRLTLTGPVLGGITIEQGSLRLGGATVPAGFQGRIDNRTRLELDPAGEFVLSEPIIGTGQVVKQGPGTVVFGTANAYTGATTIEQGGLVVADAAAVGSTEVVVQTGGTLAVAPGVVMRSPAVRLAGGLLDAESLTIDPTAGIGSLRLERGGIVGTPRLHVADGGGMALPQDAFTQVEVASLAVSEVAGGGLLDLGAGAILVGPDGITQAQVRADILAGRNGGGWDGRAGITSALAAGSGRTRAVGSVVRADGSMLIAVAAPGDADLNGMVDVFDLVDVVGASTYGSGRASGWSQGDYTYDGFTDVFDLVAVINGGAFGRGSYRLPGNRPAAATVAAVPEPTAFCLLASAALAAVWKLVREAWSTVRLVRRCSQVGCLTIAIIACPCQADRLPEPVPAAVIRQRAALVTTPEQPVRRTAAADGRLCLDFGRATFGWLRMEFARPHPPLDLRVRFGEKRLADGLIDTNPGGSIVSQEVAIRGEASASRLDVHPSWTPKYANWIPLPDRAGEVAPFRYVEIIGLPPDLAPTAILRLSRHVPFDEDASAFDCSEPALVEIWDLCKHSIKATSFAGLYVDGNRERVPYEADAYINQLCHYAVDSHYQTGRLTYEHLLDYPTWPTEWRQHLPLMAWADWLYSGDDSGLRRNYDRLREQLMLERRRPDGLFVGQSRGVPRDIVDWPQGERDGYDMRPDVKTVTSAFHARSLEAMAEIAAAIGKPSEADGFRTLRQETIRTMRARLFDERRGCYVDGLTTGGEAASGHASLHANMLPLAFGLVDPADVPRVAAFVAGKGMACSVYGSQYLLDGLFDAGEEQAAYALLTAGGDRGWLHMSRVLGSTITLEAWDAAYKPNLDWNHAWGAVPANVIARKLMGIEPLEPGFRRVRIRPQIARLERAFIRQPSPRGAIELTVVQTDARWEARVVIPRGVTGEVHLPESRAGDARGLSSASNATAASHPDSGRRVVEVRAGRTSITMHADRKAPVVTRSGDEP